MFDALDTNGDGKLSWGEFDQISMVCADTTDIMYGPVN